MSCCISTAVCCVLITSSLSGVALGYNYSLAEYIDLKETNVSVFIKRGVFDDEVVDDIMDVRRKGPALRTLQDDGNLKLPSEESDPEQMPVESGRRLDNSIVSFNDRNSFEGSLMQMTMKPIDHTVETTTTDDSVFGSVMVSMTPPGGSLDQLKAIQGIINMRKSAAARNPNDISDPVKKTGVAGPDFSGLQNMPPGNPGQHYRRMMSEELSKTGPGIQSPETNELKPPIQGLPSLYNNPVLEHMQGSLDQNRRMMSAMSGSNIPEGIGLRPSDSEQFPKINPARYAVPSGRMKDNWSIPKMPPEVYRRVFNKDKEDIYEDIPGLPKPVTYRTGPVRPTSLRTTPVFMPTNSKMSTLQENTYAIKEASPESSTEPSPKIVGPENVDYYEDDVKGLPVRRRRSIDIPIINKIKISSTVDSSTFSKFNIKNVISRDKTAFSNDVNIISNETTVTPSTPLIKLHFSNTIISNETAKNEREVRKGTKTV